MNNKITFAHVLAARPNFIKAAPLINQISENDYENIIIHTNQHYDYLMSKVFFSELRIPKPDFNLGVKSGSHAQQTGNALIEIEKVLLEIMPDFVVIYGDVNSSLSGAIAAVKQQIKVIHIESGCRSFDKKMPEEINRILIDNISDLLFCTEQSAFNNLIKMGFSSDSIFNVGNTAIDTLHDLNLKSNPYDIKYYLCTLHRPFNVDETDKLQLILDKLNKFNHKVVIPTHPRLKKNINKKYDNIIFIDPLGYLDFITTLKFSEGVISDSGGVQCETSFFKKPMLTLRKSTEHLLTLNHGNKLVDLKNLDYKTFTSIKTQPTPKEWDGNASKRIIEKIKLKFKI
ncbi:UDP-N-acetylglucosamine 2-epimerase (non-hydrolyzing) [Flavobacteriaceae bacterium]|nr:UDP-N-acetylglucosamine 2-epimerase (non-hydrolyzing) [Flavobacteriaceae bacterium]